MNHNIKKKKIGLGVGLSSLSHDDAEKEPER